MSPILGIYASSMQPALNATSYESIATVTVGAGGSSSISFSSIPSTYKHLQLRYIARSSAAVTEDSVTLRFNSDSGSNYSYHWLYGNGSSAQAAGYATKTLIYPFSVPGASFLASAYQATIIDILDYADTNKYKTMRELMGYTDNSTGGKLVFASGLWQSTSAINAISLVADSGNWAQYSQFALFGIKGA